MARRGQTHLVDPMKILFPYMARWFAQNWTRYHSLLEELGRQGHEIHVLQPPPLPGSSETNFREIESREMANVVIHDVVLNERLWNRSYPFDKLVKKAYFSLASRRQARRLIARHEIDCLLLYNIPQYFYIYLDRVRIVFDFADDYIDMLGHELGRLNLAPLRWLAASMLNKMMRDSHVVLAVSHTLASGAHGNVRVLANGVDAARLRTEAAVPRRDERPYTVGFIGSFEYFIDFDLILDTALRLPEIDFLLVGFGRDYARVEQRVKTEKIDNVILTGGVAHDEVFDYIDRMDVCLNVFKPIPVSHRTCPIKLFEYLARGKPVISTRLHELKYIDDLDFLIYADTPQELASALRDLRAHPDMAAEKARIGQQTVAERYTWQQLASRFVELVEAGDA